MVNFNEYIELSEKAKENGGPKSYINKIKIEEYAKGFQVGTEFGYDRGSKSELKELQPKLILGGVVLIVGTWGITKLYAESKERKKYRENIVMYEEIKENI